MLFSGVCYEQENVVYKALNGVMESVSQKLKDLPPDKAKAYLPKDTYLLAKVFPVLRRISAVANFTIDHRAFEPQESKRLLFRAVKEFFERLASLDNNRVIVVIDDLQWADKDSVELLRHILQPSEAPNLLLLMTSRQHPDEADLAMPGDFRVIAVNELEKSSAQTLVKEIFRKSGNTFSPEVVQKIVGETGNPYYLHELARLALTVNPGDSERAAFSLDDALRGRIEKLSSIERKLLAKVCASGRPFPQDIIFQTGTADWNKTKFYDIVDTLRDEQLVRTIGLDANHIIEPFHDRVRETVLKMLQEDLEEKRQVHEDLAKAMQSMDNHDYQALTNHWELADNPKKAFYYAVKAAEQAEEALAFEMAANFYKKAIALGKDLSEKERSKLYERMGDTLNNLGSGKEAAEAYILGCEGAEDEDRLKSKAAGVLLRSGEIETGLNTLEDVLKSNKMKLYKNKIITIIAFLWIRILLRLR
jgi:hypothetical protein